jgi:hypothetical protein
MRETRSAGLVAGTRVKVLDRGGALASLAQVRVLGILEDGRLVRLPLTDRVCWTPLEALR